MTLKPHTVYLIFCIVVILSATLAYHFRYKTLEARLQDSYDAQARLSQQLAHANSVIGEMTKPPPNPVPIEERPAE